MGFPKEKKITLFWVGLWALFGFMSLQSLAQISGGGTNSAGQQNPMAAMQDKRIVQLTGLVVSGDDQIGVPGVTIYIPSAGRGVATNAYGYFSLATQAGDSAVISAIGYKKQFYKVPNDGRISISVLIYLKADTLMLPEVEIFPWPTEELFKEAVLALKLPEGDLNNMRRNLDPYLLNKMRYQAPMSNKENYRAYMSQELMRMEARNTQPTLQLLNPFAWSRFIKSVRRGDLNKKDYRQDDE